MEDIGPIEEYVWDNLLPELLENKVIPRNLHGLMELSEKYTGFVIPNPTTMAPWYHTISYNCRGYPV